MATNAQETANQENGSRVFFESVIEKGVEPSDKDMMKIYNNYRTVKSSQMNYDSDSILGQLQEKQSTVECSTESLTIENTISHIKNDDLGNDDDYDLDI